MRIIMFVFSFCITGQLFSLISLVSAEEMIGPASLLDVFLGNSAGSDVTLYFTFTKAVDYSYYTERNGQGSSYLHLFFKNSQKKVPENVSLRNDIAKTVFVETYNSDSSAAGIHCAIELTILNDYKITRNAGLVKVTFFSRPRVASPQRSSLEDVDTYGILSAQAPPSFSFYKSRTIRGIEALENDTKGFALGRSRAHFFFQLLNLGYVKELEQDEEESGSGKSGFTGAGNATLSMGIPFHQRALLNLDGSYSIRHQGFTETRNQRYSNTSLEMLYDFMDAEVAVRGSYLDTWSSDMAEFLDEYRYFMTTIDTDIAYPLTRRIRLTAGYAWVSYLTRTEFLGLGKVDLETISPRYLDRRQEEYRAGIGYIFNRSLIANIQYHTSVVDFLEAQSSRDATIQAVDATVSLNPNSIFSGSIILGGKQIRFVDTNKTMEGLIGEVDTKVRFGDILNLSLGFSRDIIYSIYTTTYFSWYTDYRCSVEILPNRLVSTTLGARYRMYDYSSTSSTEADKHDQQLFFIIMTEVLSGISVGVQGSYWQQNSESYENSYERFTIGGTIGLSF